MNEVILCKKCGDFVVKGEKELQRCFCGNVKIIEDVETIEDLDEIIRVGK